MHYPKEILPWIRIWSCILGGLCQLLYISWLASTTFFKLWIPLSILLFIAALPKDFGMNSNPFYHPLARDFLEDVKLKIKKLKSQTELMYFSYQIIMYMCYILLKYKCGQCQKIDIRDTFWTFMKFIYLGILINISLGV